MAALHRPAIPAPRALLRRPGKLAMYVAMGLLVAAAVFQVNRFSTLASRGYEINELQRQRAERQAENHQLEADVAGLSSLARVDIEARTRLNLQPATQKMYITVHGNVPQRQSLPTRFLPEEQPAAAPAATSAEPLWRRIVGLLPGF
jgi:cell division protein FtsL